ncbi:uncharacterized protein LOC112679866 [Sipha flava]|uniref:Uncharacterized protein LOC112679866 n=1 Tax=Sipha flava TaxID=143950 RepID=A0A8B8F465_9HEMI|nr:uncharacterized protein LOC112679866 [Sipha flava]
MNVKLIFIVLLSLACQTMGRNVSNLELSRLLNWTNTRNICLTILPDVILTSCVMRYTGRPAAFLPWSSGINSKCCFNECDLSNSKMTCPDSKAKENLSEVKKLFTLKEFPIPTTPTTTRPADVDNEKAQEDLCKAVMHAKEYMNKLEFRQYAVRLTCLASLGELKTVKE